MSLLPVIDEKSTKANVREYFDKEFPRIVLQAGYSMNEIGSAHFDLAPAHTININKSENTVLDSLEAQEIVKETVKAINICPDVCSKILKNVYIKGLKNYNVQALLGYGQAQYTKLKNDAFIYFADAFTYTDLHVYEDQ